MAVMWGMTFLEDAVLNLAGLLLTVVALNPTLDAVYCNVDKTVAGGTAPKGDETHAITPEELIDANAATISRGMLSLLVVLSALLAVIAITSVVVYMRAKDDRKPSPKAVKGYIFTWSLAALVVLVYWVLFLDANNRIGGWADGGGTVNEGSPFYHQVHGLSANIAVGLIFVAVVSAARGKLPPSAAPHAPWWKPWEWNVRDWPVWTQAFWQQNLNPTNWKIWTNRYAWMYTVCAVVMAVVAAFLKGGDALGLFSGWVWLDEHATFMVEAILITLIGVFWVIQTFDRRKEGAPRY
jgi:hypothetical protein